jgi:hypothetical protein
MHDGAGDRVTALAALDELRKGIAPSKLELGRLDVVVDKSRRGRLHRYRAGNEFFSRLVDTAGIKDDEVAFLARSRSMNQADSKPISNSAIIGTIRALILIQSADGVITAAAMAMAK